ncbi:Na/Pi cotransporter family protein [Hydrogenophaga sp.]|uniref:Na/Pi cotransporter family protein n=1 Tax=Hydrogenophaga sp. TaxID=1904254 RepID=UPI00271C63F7|nr:Na/Pi cotransporter family protein [Hydrogenophaga sp.]MDO9434029.1 Na/Pi cotransporter family protein [Hydrogenophaga sp.]
MKHLLDLLAAIALLVWGTHLVRAGVLRVFGSNLRQFLAASMGNRFTAALSGLGVTALVQSSTATALITASFVGRGLIALPAALAVMLGADIGTALMAVLFSFDLSWLSPLFIFLGVILFISRQGTQVGDFGRVLIGLGLLLLALRLIGSATGVLTQNPAVQLMLSSLTSDRMLEILLGAALAVGAYSSLAVVLLASTLALQVVGLDVALGIVLGANLGSGLLAVITTAKAGISTRQVPLGNLLFKVLGVCIAVWLIPLWVGFMEPLVQDPATLTVLFHLSFNLMVGAVFIGLTQPVARMVNRLLPLKDAKTALDRPNHLDPSALATPSLAISCAAREAMHQADIVETMLRGVVTVIRNNDAKLSKDLRKLDDVVDNLYSSIKYYLTKISRQQLSEAESRRWTDIISFTINMEQIGDTVERVLLDIEDKKIRKGRNFSDAGMAEITELHGQLIDNMRLGMSVFLNGNVRDAQKLVEEKVRFRDMEREYASTHLDRLSGMTANSIDTSALHLDLISDLKRINSHICSIAYPILDSAGVLAPSRLREPPPKASRF